MPVEKGVLEFRSRGQAPWRGRDCRLYRGVAAGMPAAGLGKAVHDSAAQGRRSKGLGAPAALEAIPDGTRLGPKERALHAAGGEQGLGPVLATEAGLAGRRVLVTARDGREGIRSARQAAERLAGGPPQGRGFGRERQAC